MKLGASEKIQILVGKKVDLGLGLGVRGRQDQGGQVAALELSGVAASQGTYLQATFARADAHARAGASGGAGEGRHERTASPEAPHWAALEKTKPPGKTVKMNASTWRADHLEQEAEFAWRQYVALVQSWVAQGRLSPEAGAYAADPCAKEVWTRAYQRARRRALRFTEPEGLNPLDGAW
ncbi:hypothetical protein ASF71_20475 [Deinococcus sp. Leaf326]|nr:hypothetical protein ASF71_20475 [Deinococcus sp. Leaf326]